LGEMSSHPLLASLIERGLFLLSAMNGEDLRAAIEGPARQAGLVLDWVLWPISGFGWARCVLSRFLTNAFDPDFTGSSNPVGASRSWVNPRPRGTTAPAVFYLVMPGLDPECGCQACRGGLGRLGSAGNGCQLGSHQPLNEKPDSARKWPTVLP
jgi:hypothetical protein